MREDVEQTKKIANILRNHMTKQERMLWYKFLSRLNIRVRRQHRIENYVVDFYCDEAKVVIELDGSQHLEGKQFFEDKERDRKIEETGIIVLRYNNIEIDQAFTTTCENIFKILKARTGKKIYLKDIKDEK